MFNYKLYTAEEVLEFAKNNNIDTNKSGYDITPFLRSLSREDGENEAVIEQGFFYVQNRDDASHLGGSFLEHFGFLRLTVEKNTNGLMTIEECINDNFKWQMDLVKQYPHSKEENITLDSHLILATKEKPYTIYICGNDDASWTKTYPSEKDAKVAIYGLCMRCEEFLCGGFEDAIRKYRFVFTN